MWDWKVSSSWLGEGTGGNNLFLITSFSLLQEICQGRIIYQPYLNLQARLNVMLSYRKFNVYISKRSVSRKSFQRRVEFRNRVWGEPTSGVPINQSPSAPWSAGPTGTGWSKFLGVNSPSRSLNFLQCSIVSTSSAPWGGKESTRLDLQRAPSSPTCSRVAFALKTLATC